MRSLLRILLTIYPLICFGQGTESHHIQPGDVLQISVRGEPEISRLVIVQADGFITMPLLNEIGVAGLTVQELQTLLVERLQSFVANPEVTVSINDKIRKSPLRPMLPPLWPFVQAVHPPIIAERAG